MSRYLDAAIVPVAIALDDQLGVTLWAPAWVDEEGDEVQCFLGSSGRVLAFNSADGLVDYLANNPADDLAKHPQWPSLLRARATDLRAGPDDLVDFDDVFRLLGEPPSAASAATLSRTVQLAGAIADCCYDDELAEVLERDPYETALYFPPEHYSRKLLEPLWQQLGQEVALSWEWVCERLAGHLDFVSSSAPLDIHAVQRRGPATTPWLTARPGPPAGLGMPGGRDEAGRPVIDDDLLPSKAPTILVTVFFGLFGLIPAAVATSNARSLGVHTGRYYASFGWTMLVTVLVWVVGIVLLVGVVAASR